MKPRLNPYLVGFSGILGMSAFYFLILYAITKDFHHPLSLFLEKWYLLTPLFVGFGVQVFILQKLRIVVRISNLKITGATAGTNGMAMAACCAHHLADIFPILGLASAASVVTEYQDWFLAFGIFATVLGIVYMWIQLNKHKKMECCHS